MMTNLTVVASHAPHLLSLRYPFQSTQRIYSIFQGKHLTLLIHTATSYRMPTQQVLNFRPNLQTLIGN